VPNAGFELASIVASAGAIVTGSGPFTVDNITAATTVTATFAPIGYDLTYVATPTAGGTVTGPATISTGTTVTLTVTANPGYTITLVTASTGSVTPTAPYQLSDVTGNTTVTATFTPKTNALTYVASPGVGGTINGPATVQTGSSATVDVTVHHGYRIVTVTADNGATVTGSGPYTVQNVTADTTVTVTFAPIPPLTAVTVLPVNGNANVGGTFTFTATPTGGVGVVHYSWKKGSVAAPYAADSNTYTIPVVALSDAGDYHVDASDDDSTVASGTVTLDVAVGMPVTGLLGFGVVLTALLGGIAAKRRGK